VRVSTATPLGSAPAGEPFTPSRLGCARPWEISSSACWVLRLWWRLWRCCGHGTERLRPRMPC